MTVAGVSYDHMVSLNIFRESSLHYIVGNRSIIIKARQLMITKMVDKYPTSEHDPQLQFAFDPKDATVDKLQANAISAVCY